MTPDRLIALIVAIALAAMIVQLLGCASRKPGGEYRGRTSYDARTIDGVTESYIGIGVAL